MFNQRTLDRLRAQAWHLPEMRLPLAMGVARNPGAFSPTERTTARRLLQIESAKAISSDDLHKYQEMASSITIHERGERQ